MSLQALADTKAQDQAIRQRGRSTLDLGLIAKLGDLAVEAKWVHPALNHLRQFRTRVIVLLAIATLLATVMGIFT